MPRDSATVFFNSSYSSRGSNLRCCANCVFQQQRAPKPLAGGGFLTVFLLGLVTQFSFCGPSFARGEEDSSISPLSRQNLDRFFPSLLPAKEEEEPGFDPGSDLLSFWKRGRYRLSYGVRTITVGIWSVVGHVPFSHRTDTALFHSLTAGGL